MKHTIRLLGAFALALALTSAASAQTVDLQLVTTINTGAGTGGADQLEVAVQLDTDADFMLGNSNFRFFFNSSALSVPSGAAVNAPMVAGPGGLGEDYEYASPWGTGIYSSSEARLFQQADLVSGNLILGFAGFGSNVTDAAGFQTIMRFFFDITGPTQTEQLVWKATAPEPNPTQIFNGADNTTAIAIDMLIGSDEPLDPTAAVELSTFTTRVSDDAVTLSWSTSSESNNAGFAVELAPASSGVWSEVGFVQGAGTSSDLRSYAYNIDDLAYGTYKVRLRQMDLDGSFEYSSELEVAVELDQAFAMGDVYPSPFANRGNFSLSVRDAQPVEVAVFNLLGQKVLTVFDGDFGANETRDFMIDGGSLANGVYLVRARGAAFAETTTVAVLK